MKIQIGFKSLSPLPPTSGFFHITMTKRPDDLHISDITSPLSISPPKTPASVHSLLSPLSAAAAPSDQPSS
jgi:hypothetical protein